MDFIVESFPGLREMANIHPLIVHFPIALLSCFLLLDVMASLLRSRQLSIVAGWFLALGALGAIAAAAAGLQAALTVPHPPEAHEIIEHHRYFALNTVALAVILLLWRLLNRARFSLPGRIVYLLLAGFMMINLLFAADYGGLMVYRYGVAVKAAGIRSTGHRHGDAWDEVREWLHELIPHTHEPGHGHDHHHHAH